MVEYLKTEYGTFTNNPITGQTAKEVYQEQISNFNFIDGVWVPKQIDICPEPTIQEEVESLKEQVLELSDIIILMSQQ